MIRGSMEVITRVEQIMMVLADVVDITRVKYIMMVRRVTICATRARVRADAPDREQGGHG